MKAYLPDTNVWVHVGRDPKLTSRLEKVLAAGDKIVIAPPVLRELTRGTVRDASKRFADDKKTYMWMRDHKCEVLELPRPFMAEILGTTLPKRSGSTPKHSEQLIEMLVDSNDLDEFTERCNRPDSLWKKIELVDPIHEAMIEKELRLLERVANAGKSSHFAELFAGTFGTEDCRPSPIVMRQEFSAFIEYAESSARKIVQGSTPRKNDRGVYVDWQLLTYLARPDIYFLTNENFSGEITNSPQKARIVKPDTLPTAD